MRFFVFLILHVTILTAQQSVPKYCYFKLASVNDTSRQRQKDFNTLQFVINNQKISSLNKPFKIKLHKNRLDTIRLISTNDLIILAKLKPEQSYGIYFDPGSWFQIIPKSSHKGTELIRIVSKNRDSTKYYVQSEYYFPDLKQLWTKDTTDYFNYAYSEDREFQCSGIHFYDRNYEPWSRDLLPVEDIYIQFFGNEMYTLVFDYLTKTATLKFDGYYNKNKKIKIFNE